jgi:signal transduction histidine kinase
MTNSLVNLDKQLLRNILLNLLTNAIKYSSVKSVITFEVIKQNGELIFSVKDQGIGIPKEDQKNLFETFFRASNVENIKGTGMGLHIVKKYLDIMDGKIEFESAINKGSCFTVKFNC